MKLQHAEEKKSGDRYFWGNDEAFLTTENINFNETLDRNYDQWEEYLKPSRWGLKNETGLYQMTGNVWQFVGQNEDPFLAPWIFRIEKPLDRERLIMGGSWFSTRDFLVCGKTTNQPPGIRCPDLGIRIVREPAGANWRIKNRKVTAVTHSSGKIGISWALLSSDTKDTRFNIYRIVGNYRSHNGVKLNSEPLVNTSFVDESNVKDSTRYQYRVVTVDSSGKEGNPSDWASVIAGSDKYPVAVKFKPLFEKGDMLPVFGDLEGYGKLNCVIRLDNGCKEMSQDPGIPVQLEAFSYTGRSLWRKDIAHHSNIFGSANNCPFNVWDMNGDGKDEVITLLQIGEDNNISNS